MTTTTTAPEFKFDEPSDQQNNAAPLSDQIRAAHAALAYGIAQSHRRLCVARSAVRQYPRCALFPVELESAVLVHDRLKHHLEWLDCGSQMQVRRKAAQFVRDDLATSRRLQPRHNSSTLARPESGVAK